MSAGAVEESARPPRRVWEIELPCGDLLTSNTMRGRHWSHTQRLAESIQTAIGWLVRRNRIPPVRTLRVLTVVIPPDGHKRDPHNWQPTTKAAVDGLVKVGVIPDDSPEHLLDDGYRIADRPHHHACWFGGGGPRKRRRVHVRLVLTVVA